MLDPDTKHPLTVVGMMGVGTAAVAVVAVGMTGAGTVAVSSDDR